jgi:hypothetical protein
MTEVSHDFDHQHRMEAGRRSAQQQWANDRAAGLKAEVSKVSAELHQFTTMGVAGVTGEGDFATFRAAVATALRDAATRVEALA